MERIARHYLTAWNKRRLLLIGYSFGADVLPAIYNRLDGVDQAAVDSLLLLSLAISSEVRPIMTSPSLPSSKALRSNARCPSWMGSNVPPTATLAIQAPQMREPYKYLAATELLIFTPFQNLGHNSVRAAQFAWFMGLDPDYL